MMFLPEGEKGLQGLVYNTIKNIEPITLFDSAKLREKLVWCSWEDDFQDIRKLFPRHLSEKNHLFSADTNEIFFAKVFSGFTLDSIELLKLCRDHYEHLIKKNEESIQKQTALKNPVHLERAWHRDLKSLSPLIR
jgi:hypothetical protein